MIIVVDANAVVSALLKDGMSRQIIVSGKFTIVAPEYLSEELYKYRKYIAKKAGISDGEVELLITLLLRRIRIVPNAEYRNRMSEAMELMENDVKDAPYAACFLELRCDGIWTNDTDFDGKAGIKVFRTEYLMKLL